MENVFRHHAASETLYTAAVTPVCEKYGLTYMEFTVLMFLANNPVFDTASDVVKYRHLTKSHVSLSVHSLQEKGLLKGEHHERNRRTVHLSLLDPAAPIVADGREAQERFGDILFAGFTQEEREWFISFIKKIDGNIIKHIAQLHGSKE